MNQQIFQTNETVGAGALSARQAVREDARDREEHQAPIATHDGDGEMVNRLLPRFEAETRRYRKQVRNAIRLGVVGAVVVMLTNAISILVAAQRESDFPLAMTVGMLTLYVLLLLAGAVPPLRSSARRNHLRDLLVHCNDVRVVGPLTELLTSSDPQIRSMAAAMLTELLPRVKADEAHLLNADHRLCLCGVLGNGAREDNDLAVAILRTFARVGDSSVLSLVERIADSPAHTRRSRRLKAEAEQCLPLLQAHVQQEEASRTLLRASSRAKSASNTLLRPAADSTFSHSEQLLRATDSRDESKSPAIEGIGRD